MKNPRPKPSLDIGVILEQRRNAVSLLLSKMRSHLIREARKDLNRKANPQPEGIGIFRSEFVLPIGTTDRRLAEMVCAVMSDVPQQNYQFSLREQSAGLVLLCERLKERPEPCKFLEPSVGFNIEAQFFKILRKPGKRMRGALADYLEFVTDMINQEMCEPDRPENFKVYVAHHKPAIAWLAFKVLQRAQKRGWVVELASFYDAAQTFRFNPPQG